MTWLNGTAHHAAFVRLYDETRGSDWLWDLPVRSSCPMPGGGWARGVVVVEMRETAARKEKEAVTVRTDTICRPASLVLTSDRRPSALYNGARPPSRDLLSTASSSISSSIIALHLHRRRAASSPGPFASMEVAEPVSIAQRKAALTMGHIRPGPPLSTPGSRGPPPPPPARPPRAPSSGPPDLPKRPPPRYTSSESSESSPRTSVDGPPARPPLPSRPPLPPRTSQPAPTSTGPPPLPGRPKQAPSPARPVAPARNSTWHNQTTDKNTHRLPPPDAIPPPISSNSWSKNPDPALKSLPKPPPRKLGPSVPFRPKPLPRIGSEPSPEAPREPPNLPDRTNSSPHLSLQRTPVNTNRSPYNILEGGFGGKKGKLPSPPRTPELPADNVAAPHDPTPPPINIGTKPKPGGPPPLPAARPTVSHAQSVQRTNGVCLKCRDFSQPDAHAAMFPRHAYNDVQRLALDLTAPFESATDKARVIFTWLHHNVVYDVQGFFNNTVKPSTPASTLKTGLAVCEGYAGLFAAMAVYAGLEAIVVSGHGKGYGWTETDKSYVPPFKGNHAWNACRIDGGEWHLIDPCWGAGHLDSQKNTYNQTFDPEHFTGTNEEFGKRHYPAESEYQFLDRPITWEQYFLMQEDAPTMFCHMSNAEFNYGKNTVEPRQRVLSPYKRHNFRLAGICEHTAATTQWLLLLGNGQDEEVMESDGRGGLVGSIAAGASGTKVQIRAVQTFNQESGKGLTRKRWEDRHKGGWSCSTVSICEWVVG
ncbi:hypothetical protein Dda_7963 [Drechslerella dactyloides]|uniref:Transglutaminase-like domain-containing protein n=1 Tax=Drechslerella dactyloides TaxID=74499 RepID=A0AAD6NHS8_DREDA|nr:hypothetical protein Dda_7963 [Drechslerella dactyloides]